MSDAESVGSDEVSKLCREAGDLAFFDEADGDGGGGGEVGGRRLVVLVCPSSFSVWSPDQLHLEVLYFQSAICARPTEKLFQGGCCRHPGPHPSSSQTSCILRDDNITRVFNLCTEALLDMRCLHPSGPQQLRNLVPSLLSLEKVGSL